MAVQDDNSFQSVINRFEDDVLALAYYIKDRDVICGFLPDSVTYSVHPDLWVLTAVEELVSGSRLDKIGEAVAMLEHLHSHYPDMGGEREYVNLIVDMKTKASTYELFFAGVVSESEKQAILDKYFDPDLCNSQLPPPDSQSDYGDLSDNQYNLTIHSVARNGILNMMSSSERCRQFQQTIMNPLYSPAIHENLLRNLRSYLDQIKRQLPVPTLLQSFAATCSSQSQRSRPLPIDTGPRAVTDGDDYSQPPLLDEPSTSGLRLHTPPPPPPPTDGGAEKKKVPLIKPVEIRVTPCLIKQPPSQQPLFESSASHQSDLGSEATVTYESDSAKRSAYKLRDRKGQQLSSPLSSDSEDVFKDCLVKTTSKIRKSPRQKAARRRRVNGTRESVYKDLSSSEIESSEDTESMDTVSGGVEESTELSGGTKSSNSEGAQRSKGISAGGTPTKLRKSARLQNLDSGSRRISPKKVDSSSESEGSRKFRATAFVLRRSDRKLGSDKTEFQICSPYKRDSSQESDNSRKSRTTLRRSGRKHGLEFQSSSPHKRDSSQESDDLRKSPTTVRRSERKHGLDRAEFQTSLPDKRDSSQEADNVRKSRTTERKKDKLEFQTSSPHKRDNSHESGNSRSSRAAAVELRRGERKRGLDKAGVRMSSLHKRDSSLESENSRKSRIKLRRSERKQCSDLQTSSLYKRDSSSESENTRKSRTTASELRRSERRRELDKIDLQTSSFHKSDSSLESEDSRKSSTKASELKRSERRRNLDKADLQTSSFHKRDSSLESEDSIKSSTTAPELRRSERRRNLDKADLQTSSLHKRDSSLESEDSRKSSTTASELRRSERRRNLDKDDLQTSSFHKRDSSLESVKLRRSDRKHILDETDFQTSSPPPNRDSSSESESTTKSRASATLKVRRSERKQCSDLQTTSLHKRDSSSESENTRKSRTTALGLRRGERRRDLDKADLRTSSSHKKGSCSESESTRKSKATVMTLRSSKDSNKINFQAHSPRKRDSSSESESSSEEESKLRQSKRIKLTKTDLKIKSPKKKPSSASHTESDSESNNALGTHHQYILRQKEKDNPAKLSSHNSQSQTQPSNPIISELKSKYQSLFTSESDQSDTGLEVQNGKWIHGEKGQLTSKAAHCANFLQKVIDSISTESDHNDAEDGTDATSSRASTEAKKTQTKWSRYAASDQERKRTKSKGTRHTRRLLSDKTTPLATFTNSAVGSDKGVRSETTTPATKSALGNNNGVPSKAATPAIKSAIESDIEVPSKAATLATKSVLGNDNGVPSKAATPATKSALGKDKGVPSKPAIPATKSAIESDKEVPSKPVTLATKSAIKSDKEVPSKPATLATKSAVESDKGVPSKTTTTTLGIKPAVESSERVPSKTAALATNAAVQDCNGVASKDTPISNICGHRLRSHPGNRPSTSPQTSVAQSSLSPINLRAGKIRKGHIEPQDSPKKQDQRDEAVQHKSATTETPVDNQTPKERRKDRNSGPRKSKSGRRKSDIQRIKAVIAELSNSSMRRSPRMHASSAAQDIQARQEHDSRSLTEKRSKRLANTKDSNPSPMHHATAQSTPKHVNFATVTDSAGSAGVVSSGNTPQKSPENVQQSPDKALSPYEARASLPLSLPREFYRPKKRLSFSQNSSGGDSDSMKNTVKRVRFAPSSDSEELSETDDRLLAIASESHQEKEPPKKNPAVDTASIEASSTESSLQVASEIIVSSDASGPAQSPSILSNLPSDGSKKRRATKVPRTPPTQLSLRGDEGVRLPSPPLGTSTVLHCSDTLESDTAQDRGSSGIRTVLSQVSQLQRKGRPRKRNGQSASRNKVQSKTACRKVESPKKTARSPSAQRNANKTKLNSKKNKSPQGSKVGTTAASVHGATGGKSTRKRGRPRKSESSDKDESATKPASPKKRKKECDTYVPPVSYQRHHNSSERDSATSSRSPRKRSRKRRSSSGGRSTGKEEVPAHYGSQGEVHTTASSGDVMNVSTAVHTREHHSSRAGRLPGTKRSNRKEATALHGSQGETASTSGDTMSVSTTAHTGEHHSSSGGRDTGRSNREEAPAHHDSRGEVPVTASTSGDAASVSTAIHSGSRDGSLCVGNLSSNVGDRGTGRSNRDQSSIHYGSQREVLQAQTALPNPGTVYISTTSYSGSRVGVHVRVLGVESPLLAQQGSPGLALATHSIPTYSEANKSTTLGRSNSVLEQQAAFQGDETIQSPEIDVVGYTPEYSEPAEAVDTVVMGSQDQSHPQLGTTPGYRSNPADSMILLHHPYTGCPSTVLSLSSQSTVSNADRLVCTQAPFTSNSGHSHSTNLHQSTTSLGYSPTPYTLDSGQSHMSLNKSTAERVVYTHPLHTSNSGLLSTNLSMSYRSTPSNADRLVCAQPPFTSNSGHSHITNLHESTTSNLDRLVNTATPYTSDGGQPHVSNSGHPSTVLSLSYQSPVSNADRLVGTQHLVTSSSGHSYTTNLHQSTTSNLDRLVNVPTPYTSDGGQPHMSLNQSTTGRVVYMQPLHASNGGLPTPNPTTLYQSTPSNADRLVYTHTLYTSSNGRPYTNVNQSTLSNTDRRVYTHAPYAPSNGRPSTIVNQSTPSNADKWVYTHTPYTPSNGRPSINMNQSTPSNTDRRVYTHTPYTSNTGRLSTNVNQSTPSNADRRIFTHTPYRSNIERPSTNVNQSTTSNANKQVYTQTQCTPSNGRPSTNVNQSTPSNADSRVNTHTPSDGRPSTNVNQSTRSNADRQVHTYTSNNIGHPRSDLSTWYHENSPGNSPEIGLMNDFPYRAETPHSLKQQQQQSFRTTNLGAYLPTETSRHEQLNLIDDEYELSQVQSQYYHAPVQRLARQMHNLSDNESVVSDSSTSVLSVPR